MSRHIIDLAKIDLDSILMQQNKRNHWWYQNPCILTYAPKQYPDAQATGKCVRIRSKRKRVSLMRVSRISSSWAANSGITDHSSLGASLLGLEENGLVMSTCRTSLVRTWKLYRRGRNVSTKFHHKNVQAMCCTTLMCRYDADQMVGRFPQPDSVAKWTHVIVFSKSRITVQIGPLICQDSTAQT